MLTRDDAIIILSTLKAAYPHAYKGLTRRDAEATINLWIRQFADEESTAVAAAVEALISTRTVGYSITPGEVKEQLYSLKSAESLNESDAWALVSRACSNGIYGYREEFAKLPPEVQRAVGAPEQLKAWAMMEADTVESVVASNFMKNYRIMKQREKETAMLPQTVREMLSGVSDSLKMLEE